MHTLSPAQVAAAISMQFRILSHAGLEVRALGKSVVFDPWLVGSTYWRSWWNYPPPSRELIASLKPDLIALTHVHWDHFQGPSLRLWGRNTPILVPRGHYDRMKRDLTKMGFTTVVELRHGQRYEVVPGFAITSYQFNPFLDSAYVCEADGVTLFNANDAKFMGGPLDQILRRHPSIDFVFRSHSSANSRLCYEVVDDPNAPTDDLAAYVKQFAAFVIATKAHYAVPFASNHCYLHEETRHFNDTVQTPLAIEEYFRDHIIDSPQLTVMLSGDSWSSEHGLSVDPNRRRYFADRKAELDRYRESMRATLEAAALREARANIGLHDVRQYFERFTNALPLLARVFFRGHPVTYVVHAGERRWCFLVNLEKGTVSEASQPIPLEDGPLEIHTSAFILRQCIALDLFSHLPISKRVRYRVSRKTKRYIAVLNLLFNAYEYDYLPLGDAITGRALENWLGRWRELLLILSLAKDFALHRRIDVRKYLAATDTSL